MQVLRYSLERVGANLTYSCLNDNLLSVCQTHGHGLIGTMYGAVDACPTRRGRSTPILNTSEYALNHSSRLRSMIASECF